MRSLILTAVLGLASLALTFGSAGPAKAGGYGYGSYYSSGYKPYYRPAYGFSGPRKIVAVPVKGGFPGQPISLGQPPLGPGGPGAIPPGGIASAPNGPGAPGQGAPGQFVPGTTGPGQGAPGQGAP